MPTRTPQEIRASVEVTRQELQYSINDLQGKINELTDWRSQLARHRKQVLIGAAVLLFFMVFALIEFLGWGISDWTGLNIWVSFGIVTGAMLVLAGLLAMLGIRSVKRGSPPVPELAIEEAKKTRAAIEEARS